jgi:hypothetical protein
MIPRALSLPKKRANALKSAIACDGALYNIDKFQRLISPLHLARFLQNKGGFNAVLKDIGESAG